MARVPTARAAYLRPLLGLLAAVAAVGCDAPADGEAAAGEHQTPVAAVELVPRDLSRQLTSSAPVQPRATIRLASRVAGTLEAVLVEEGEAVERGQVLARLDMEQEEAQLARARAQEEQARQERRRLGTLRQSAVVSASEYERARTELLVAESERKLWEARLAYGRVTAPRDAVVTVRYVEPGEAVDARDTLFELAAMDELVVRPGVSELDVVHLREGQPVPVRLDAFSDMALAGSIRRIFPVADPGSRLVSVEILLPPDAFERGVRPGFLARIRMPIDERADVVAVPSAAIGEDGEERYVYVIEEGRLRYRAVELGVTRGQWTQVVSGLEAGQIVLATNPIDMSDGQAVRIVGWRG